MSVTGNMAVMSVTGNIAVIQFSSIQFILRSSDPGGVLDPEDIEHVN